MVWIRLSGREIKSQKKGKRKLPNEGKRTLSEIKGLFFKYFFNNMVLLNLLSWFVV